MCEELGHPSKSTVEANVAIPEDAVDVCKSTSRGASASSTARPYVLVLKRYQMFTSEDAIMGEGTSSICRRGCDMQTGDAVAIKRYKLNVASSEEDKEVTMQKFIRQVEVLTELQKPFEQPSDPKLWHPLLGMTSASKLFMRLLDYSQDADGSPAVDSADGVMYVVTELASYSMKDFIRNRREQKKPMQKPALRAVARSMLLAIAGLHAKGFIHMDLKPENLMIFNGVLKVIDVDGCTKIGTMISVDDASLSFSPCYCAPEWARFLIDDSDDPRIRVDQGLDAWSIGLTIAELATLDAVFKPRYASFLGKGRSHREAGFLFMEWLGNLTTGRLPPTVERLDPDLAKFLEEWLLVGDVSKRKTCAECLDSPYAKAAVKVSVYDLKNAGVVGDGEDQEPSSIEDAFTGRSESENVLSGEVPHRPVRHEDRSKRIIHKGTLWKLNNTGESSDPTAWLMRDMWIAPNGCLCYFSFKENKRLVLLDSHVLHDAEFEVIPDGECVKDRYGFRIIFGERHNFGSVPSFAASSPEERDQWISMLQRISHDSMDRVDLGREFAKEVRQFRLNVRNRRIKADEKDEAAMVKRKLWKVKGEGDRMKPEHWFERVWWITTGGNLVYYSERDEQDLIYYTAEDLARCTIREIPGGESAKPWAFAVHLPPVGDVEFAPGEFAAETEEEMREWIAALKLLRAA